VKQTGAYVSPHGLDKLGLSNLGTAHWNLPVPALYEQALRRGEGSLADGGPLCVLTGQHTGRSANDKFIVKEPTSEKDIDWGNVNRPIDAANFDVLRRRMLAYLQNRDVFVLDTFGGADPTYRLPVRIVTEHAWQSLFARNMFIRPTPDEQRAFTPEFTIICAPGFQADPKLDGTRSETFILMNFAERMVLIGGTSYAGEVKKSVFSILNYLLPARDVLPMLCSVNVGADGGAAIFFGLSGTGKTTLSADASRTLVGDDEHGWSEHGLFNFEGGCYAKVINLSAEAEPEIYATTRRYGTVLENVVVDADTRILDLNDNRHTENTRGCYPIDFIPNASPTGRAGHPTAIIMLTADAFGVLPPIARLTPDQAMYHFLSGYTARVAGTEKGLGNEPQATFSTCFGAPFMPRHPSVYAKLLGQKMAKHGASCWLVNTGWTAGGYGAGYRMPIQHTRALVTAAREGKLANGPTRIDPNFRVAVPTACPGVPEEALNPRTTWKDGKAYDTTARDLAGRFNDNFVKFEPYVDGKVKAAAPKLAA
jgi:phosphoenolpyruvate carboxykinase (ATP)